MPNIKNCVLEKCGTEPFERQQFGTAGVEGVKARHDNEDNTGDSVILTEEV